MGYRGNLNESGGTRYRVKLNVRNVLGEGDLVPNRVLSNGQYVAGARVEPRVFVFTVALGWIFSSQYFCSDFAAALLATIAYVALSHVIRLISDDSRRASRIRGILVAGLPICMLFTPLMRLPVASAFEVVFGMSPPPGVTVQWARKCYCGGSGDHDVLVFFAFEPDASPLLLDESWQVVTYKLKSWRESGSGWSLVRDQILNTCCDVDRRSVV